MIMVKEEDRKIIREFKIQYQYRAQLLQKLRDLTDPLDEIQNRMENYKSPQPHVNAGRVSAKECDNDSRLLALIDQKMAIEQHDGERIRMLTRMIGDLDVSKLMKTMPEWSLYVLDRVYRQGATFDEVTCERRDCNYSRRQLMRRLDFEIIRAQKNATKMKDVTQDTVKSC